MALQDLRKGYLPPLAPEDFYALLSYATGKPKEFLLAHPEYEPDAKAEARAREFFSRRMKHEPVAYIVGEKEFFGLPFRVTPDTLIPRPETETLVEQVIEQLTVNEKQEGGAQKQILIADIGTGSGAIIISVAHELRRLHPPFSILHSPFAFHAIDISQAALTIAKENAERNDVADMISFHHGNLIEPIAGYFSEADEIMLIANLPYLSEKIYSSADDDVKRYEPESALLSGNDGLEHYRALFASIAKETAALASYRLSVSCEISPEQDTLMTGLFEDVFPQEKSHILPDLSGRSRIFSFRLDKS